MRAEPALCVHTLAPRLSSSDGKHTHIHSSFNSLSLSLKCFCVTRSAGVRVTTCVRCSVLAVYTIKFTGAHRGSAPSGSWEFAQRRKSRGEVDVQRDISGLFSPWFKVYNEAAAEGGWGSVRAQVRPGHRDINWIWWCILGPWCTSTDQISSACSSLFNQSKDSKPS